MANTFRNEYRELSASEKADVADIKAKAEMIEATIARYQQSATGNGRQLALAMTNLEQAVMWAVKAITG